MTYEERYTVLNNGNAHTDLTLYEAAKKLKELAAEGKLTDGTCVKERRRHVAFFCQWRETVRPMFEANAEERSVLEAWS